MLDDPTCEMCQRVLPLGRSVRLAEVLEAQLCAACQRAFDLWIETHPAFVASRESQAWQAYWLAQAHWSAVKQEYLESLRRADADARALRQVVRAWLAEESGHSADHGDGSPTR